MPEVKPPSEWEAAYEVWLESPTTEAERKLLRVGDPRAEFRAGYLAALESPSAAPEPGGWLPIESHTDHFAVLVCRGRRICVAFKDVTGTWQYPSQSRGCVKLKFEPTHYQPLPAPPQPSRQAGVGK